MRNLVLSLAALVALIIPAGVLAGPGDIGPGQGPNVVVHQPPLIEDTATLVTVWGHGCNFTNPSYTLNVYLNDNPAEVLFVSTTVTEEVKGVDDCEYVIDVSGLSLEEGDVLAWEFVATDGATYTDQEETDVVAE